ncbi:MAG: transporter, major facilitator family protein [Bacilli bacterium]|nr:transporter, major facilitator family protein [Bacilli bacterium]
MAKGDKKIKLDRKTIFSGFVLKLLFIMFVVEFVKGALMITFLPVYMNDVLGATALVIGWTLAVQYLSDNLLRTPIGWIIDHIGYRASMLTGVLLSFGAVAIIATTSSYFWIIVACALLGIGTAPLWPCVITGTTEIAGEQSSGTIMSVVYIAWLSGVGLGPFVITFFMDKGHYNSAFTLLIGMMVAVLIVAFFLPGKKKDIQAKDSQHKHVPAERIRPLRGSRITRIKNYLSSVRKSLTISPLMFPAMFAQTFALGLLAPVLTLYATKILALSGSQYRFFLIAGGFITVLFMVPVGKLVDRWGTKWFLNIGFLLASLALMQFTYTRSIMFVYALVVLLGFSYALIIPSWNALIAAAIPPERRGAVWGFFLTIEGMGTTIGPVVSGKIWDDLGPHAPFVTSGCVLFLLFLTHLYISQKKKVGAR